MFAKFYVDAQHCLSHINEYYNLWFEQCPDIRLVIVRCDTEKVALLEIGHKINYNVYIKRIVKILQGL